MLPLLHFRGQLLLQAGPPPGDRSGAQGGGLVPGQRPRALGQEGLGGHSPWLPQRDGGRGTETLGRQTGTHHPSSHQGHPPTGGTRDPGNRTLQWMNPFPFRP